MSFRHCVIGIACAALVVPAWAGGSQTLTEDGVRNPHRGSRDMNAERSTAAGTGSTTGSDIGLRAWGLRVGLTDDPDQVIGGVHFNLGELAPRLRFQPDVQLGVGDDYTTLFGTAPVYYRFETDTRFTPYAGGGVSLGFVDRDLPAGSSADDTEFEIGGKLTGGLEWPRRHGQAFFVELSLGLGDIHDVEVLAAWSF